MVAIHNLAKNNIKIIEDASHAPLAEYSDSKGKLFKVGSCAHSDMTVISCHAIKHIAMGEGGVILTNNKNYADKAMRYRSHGIIRNPNMWMEKNLTKRNFGIMKCKILLGIIGLLKCNVHWGEANFPV